MPNLRVVRYAVVEYRCPGLKVGAYIESMQSGNHLQTEKEHLFDKWWVWRIFAQYLYNYLFCSQNNFYGTRDSSVQPMIAMNYYGLFLGM